MEIYTLSVPVGVLSGEKLRTIAFEALGSLVLTGIQLSGGTQDSFLTL